MSGDDELRSRLSRLADEGAPRLDDAARRRVLDRVEREGPRGVAGARFTRVAGFGVALAAAAGLLFFFATTEVTEDSAAAMPEGPACAGWGAAIATPREGLLRLGRRGEARFDGELSMSAPDGCTTELELAHGRVDVRADDLGEGTLRVRAGDVSVEVRGTLFSVLRDEDHVEVIVEEGHVVVRAPSEREIHLRGGERWSRGATSASVAPPEAAVDGAPAAADAESAVEPRASRVVPRGIERPTTEPPISDPARLAEAEQLWARGERDAAREVFRDVGGGRGSIAEASWLRLARLEVATGELGNAARALSTQRRRFPRSRLGPEVLWLEGDIARRDGDAAARERAHAELRERYPDSPQARALAHRDEPETP